MKLPTENKTHATEKILNIKQDNFSIYKAKQSLLTMNIAEKRIN